jgi:hypothetical protein
MLLEPSLIPSTLSWYPSVHVSTSWARSGAQKLRYIRRPRLKHTVKPSVKHQDEWLSWTRATCKATHSWVNGTATCTIQAQPCSACSVLPYAQAEWGSVQFLGRAANSLEYCTATYTRVHFGMTIKFDTKTLAAPVTPQRKQPLMQNHVQV